MEPLLCVVSSWLIKRVYIILISNTIRGSFNLDICFYHCWILTLILHLKVLFNLLLLFIIYIVNLPVVQPRSCSVIYYFNTHSLGIRHQSFNRVTLQPEKTNTKDSFYNTQLYITRNNFLSNQAKHFPEDSIGFLPKRLKFCINISSINYCLWFTIFS